jgi:hypothetical protein
VPLFKRNAEPPADAAPQPLAEYRVTYKGGLPELPKAKIGGIELKIWPDRLTLDPTTASKKFWQSLAIPYAAVSDLQIVRRQVGTGEAILAGVNAQNLAQDNNIHITYQNAAGQPIILRVEMLTGITVQGQAKKCAEFNDLLNAHSIRRAFAAPPATPSPIGSLADELAKLQQLLQAGALSTDEFERAKARLLN